MDVNQAWDLTSAIKGMALLQAGGIDLVEQPIPLWGHPRPDRLSQRFSLPILADEAVATAYDGYALASGRFTGAYALKIAKAGGPAQALKLAHVAQRSRRRCAVRRHDAGRYARHGGVTARLVDGENAVGHRNVRPLLLKDDIVVSPLDFSDGQVTLRKGPGLGVEIDEDKLRYYARK
ncbi:enolase C-terminal domain-like protein [Lelliottia nimipressuralis]|uniref:enolase C-terminal domain-like protein n=1 Tax=Lelliottia nimipressuralis TaxID=69220 RepID=UPI003D2B5460